MPASSRRDRYRWSPRVLSNVRPRVRPRRSPRWYGGDDNGRIIACCRTRKYRRLAMSWHRPAGRGKGDRRRSRNSDESPRTDAGRRGVSAGPPARLPSFRLLRHRQLPRRMIAATTEERRDGGGGTTTRPARRGRRGTTTIRFRGGGCTTMRRPGGVGVCRRRPPCPWRCRRSRSDDHHRPLFSIEPWCRSSSSFGCRRRLRRGVVGSACTLYII
mmetsp:Transcript_5336/g.13351  ORF Transcript_5336/g.13351 Transcript_5336/m.13351 type:complete len:215 (-) Transcript_5336:146-790(-)